MVKKIMNIVIVLGLIAGFPGVMQAVSSDLNIMSAAQAQEVRDTKVTRKWAKRVDRLYARNPHYQQISDKVNVSAMALNGAQSKECIGQDVYAKGLQALLLTVKNDTQDLIFVNADSLSLPILSQEMLYAQLLGDISYLKVGSITFGAALGMWLIVFSLPYLISPGSAIGSLMTLEFFIPFYWPLFIVGDLSSSLLVLSLTAFMFCLVPTVLVLSGIYIWQRFAWGSNYVHYAMQHYLLKKNEHFALYPGQRLDKIICVDKDTAIDSFTLKLYGMTEDVAPFVVMP